MQSKNPKHVFRDAGRHSYDSTTELISRMEQNFDPADPELHAVIASNAMQAAFMHFYVAARMSKQNVSATRLAKIWVDTMTPQLEQIERAFNNAILGLSNTKGNA
jgi:hypothetical protein